MISPSVFISLSIVQSVLLLAFVVSSHLVSRGRAKAGTAVAARFSFRLCVVVVGVSGVLYIENGSITLGIFQLMVAAAGLWASFAGGDGAPAVSASDLTAAPLRPQWPGGTVESLTTSRVELRNLAKATGRVAHVGSRLDTISRDVGWYVGADVIRVTLAPQAADKGEESASLIAAAEWVNADGETRAVNLDSLEGEVLTLVVQVARNQGLALDDVTDFRKARESEDTLVLNVREYSS